MKNFITPTITALLILLLFSCDKVNNPIPIIEVIPGNDSTAVRRILMEEFTGHYCSNCPQGAAEMHRLAGVYDNQIIPVSLHAGNVTFNEPHTGSGSYETDFRTPEGDAYASQFQPFGLPSGMVSRKNNGTAIAVSQWEASILASKDLAPIAEITIASNYNASTRDAAIKVETEWLIDGGAGLNYKLQVYIIEDHISDWQLDGSTNISNYDHRHVLRGSVNTIWGEAITTATTIGSKDIKTYSYVLDSGWDEDNCEIVAFIYKEGPDYEVMQANIKHVK